MATWIGRTIGGCEVVEEIGRGGMAVVYRAYQPQLERWVAIKVLRTTDAEREEFLARFRREARAIAALRHPNILTIHDYGEEQGVAYIVEEYVPGGSLKLRLTGQPLAWEQAAGLILPVGEALAYAHSRDIVHRDVKPANILLGRPDWPLLADFGLAKLLQVQRGITRPGTSLGTPAYLSPEQAVGEEVDHRTDVYGLGVVLYELLTGQIPFRSASPVETLMRRISEPPIAPCALCPQIPPELDAIILRALDADRDARYPSMQALLGALRRVPGAAGGRAEPRQEDAAPSGITERLGTQETVQGPRLVVAASQVALPLPTLDEVWIGRADANAPSSCDVDLEPHGGASAGVSRRHARLTRGPQGWSVEDARSTNGTFLNEVRLPGERPFRLHAGDRVRLGMLTLIFHEE
jgi:serine/threonine protein kinase